MCPGQRNVYINLVAEIYAGTFTSLTRLMAL